jgi:hypothetical protein
MTQVHKVNGQIHITDSTLTNFQQGDWVYRDSGAVFKMTEELLDYYESIKSKDTHKRYKIILTTDQELIEDGVQEIDDDLFKKIVTS